MDTAGVRVWTRTVGVMMHVALGTWLRKQRQARGWNMPEMAHQLRRAAKASGDVLPGPGALVRYVRRWEEGHNGVSERYRLHFCKAFGIEPDDFGPSRPWPARPGEPVSPASVPASGPGVRAALAGPPVPYVTPGQAAVAASAPGTLVPFGGPGAPGRPDAGLLAPQDVAYRWIAGARYGRFLDRTRGRDGSPRGQRTRRASRTAQHR